MSELITTLEKKADLASLLDAGADMIVLSVDGLSSNAAEKLNLSEVDEVVSKTHAAGKRAAALANITFHENMVENAQQILAHLIEAQIDAIFFADPAVYYLAKQYDFVSKLIYDPETLMTSVRDADWWIRRGVQGISVSPLLTLDETEEITLATKKAVITVHGRTLLSRSYRSLLGAYKEKYGVEEELVGRRDLHLIESKRDGHMPVYEDGTGTMIYSDDVLVSFEFIDALLASEPMGMMVGGSYLPIEEQLAAVRAYRRIMNGESSVTVGKEYSEQFSNELLDSGYYGQKTVK